MCIFGKTATPEMKAKVTPAALTPSEPPTPEPIPSPSPSKESAQSIQEKRRKRLAHVRRGILSTIKTSPLGVVGAGADLTGAGGGKTTFGA